MEPEIDVAARKRLAELARHLATGRSTNFEFDDAVPRSSERAIHKIYFNGLWPLYDDLVLHRLTGRWALTPEGRLWVARIILFLRSDQPYRYYTPGRLAAVLSVPLALVTLGLSTKLWQRYKWRDADISVWPFYSYADYEKALENPVYLNRRNAA